MKASQPSVRSSILLSYLDLLLTAIILKKVDSGVIFVARVVSRASDLPRHMKTHDLSAKYVLLFFLL